VGVGGYHGGSAGGWRGVFGLLSFLGGGGGKNERGCGVREAGEGGWEAGGWGTEGGRGEGLGYAVVRELVIFGM